MKNKTLSSCLFVWIRCALEVCGREERRGSYCEWQAKNHLLNGFSSRLAGWRPKTTERTVGLRLHKPPSLFHQINVHKREKSYNTDLFLYFTIIAKFHYYLFENVNIIRKYKTTIHLRKVSSPLSKTFKVLKQ